MDSDLTAALHGINDKLDRIERSLKVVRLQEKIQMTTLDELIAATEKQTTVEQSVEELIRGLRDQLTAAGVDQAKIDQAFANVESNTARLSDALVANTPNA